MSLEQDIFDEIDNLNLKEAACLLADIEGYKQPLVDINQFITDPDYLGSMFLVEGKMKLFSIWVDALNQIFPNPYYSPYYECLAGDTLLDLLDGRTLPIREVVREVNLGNNLQVISYDIQGKSIVPGNVVAAAFTGVKEVYRVTLDNGKSFEATGNHEVLTVDKKYRRVDKLKVGSKLLPFNMSVDKYRTVQNPDTGELQKLYRLMAAWKYGYLHKLQVHHKDHNPLNDSPANLCCLYRDAHFRHHSKSINADKKDPIKGKEISAKLSAGQKRSYERNPKRREDLSNHFKNLWNDSDKMKKAVRVGVEHKKERMQKDEEFRDYIHSISAENLRRYNASLTPDQVKERTDKGRELLHNDPNYEESRRKRKDSLSRHMKGGQAKEMNAKAQQYFSEHPEAVEANRQRVIARNSDPDFKIKCQQGKLIKRSYKIYSETGELSYNRELILKYFDSIEDFEFRVKTHNHKVIKIEYVGIRDVYDLEVEEFHNFSLNCGVFVHNCAFSGSIGAGKSTCGRIVLLYDLYKLLMLKDPFLKYSLIASDAIVLALFTANLNLARTVLYKPFRELVQASPVLRGMLLDPKKESGAIEFPHNILIQAGSRFTHALGMAVFSGLLDEASFMQESENTHQAYDSYISMSRRMKSRFMAAGGVIPGHLVLISSKTDDNAFLEKHIEESKNDPHFICFDHPIWEAHKDKGIYCGEKFKVFSGTALQSPKILEEGDPFDKYPADKILDVPVEYRKEFTSNITKALMDLAGTTTVSMSKYIVFPEELRKAVRLVHCCNVADHIMLDFHDDTRLIEFVDVPKLMLYLNLLQSSPRYIHIDIGVSHDSFGFAMSTVAGMRDVEKFELQELIQEPSSTGLVMRSEPIIRTELALSIRSINRVPLWKIRDFIMDLSELGFPIVKITADTFQSEDTLQLLAKAGYETDTLSMDRTKEPHITFRNALYEGRVELPDNPLLVTEFTELVDRGKKFDHNIDGCFTGDTCIDLLNGESVPIESLVNNFDGQYVYSFSEGKVVAGKITNCFMSKQVDTLAEVTLDNGEKIRCTVDHRFMLRDGSYAEAQDLVAGQSLMPLYRKVGSFLKYRLHYNPIEESWHYDHRSFCNEVLDEDWSMVHHRNFNKFDNTPTNLVRVNRLSHAEFHAVDYETISKKVEKYWERKRLEDPEGYNQFFRDLHHSYRVWLDGLSDEDLDKLRKRRSASNRNYWENNPDKREEHSNKLREVFSDPSYRAYMSEKALIRYATTDVGQRVSNTLKKRHAENPEYWETSRTALREYATSENGRSKSRDNANLLIDRVRSGEVKRSHWVSNMKGKHNLDPKFRNFVEAGSKEAGKFLAANPVIARRGHLSRVLNFILKEKITCFEDYDKCKGNTRIYKSETLKELGVDETIFEVTEETKLLYLDKFFPFNHKVVSVEIIKVCEPVPVYDITVEDYHNFALSSGVFVHNSKDISDAVVGSHYTAFKDSGSYIDFQ